MEESFSVRKSKITKADIRRIEKREMKREMEMEKKVERKPKTKVKSSRRRTPRKKKGKKLKLMFGTPPKIKLKAKNIEEANRKGLI